MKMEAERSRLLGLSGTAAATRRGLEADVARHAHGPRHAEGDGGEEGASVPSGARPWASAEVQRRSARTRLKGVSIAAALAASPPPLLSTVCVCAHTRTHTPPPARHPV